MTEKKVSATARIRLTVEVAASGGGWGHTCQVDQVFRQAGREATEGLRRVLLDAQVSGALRATIIGEPEVIAVMAEEK